MLEGGFENKHSNAPLQTAELIDDHLLLASNELTISQNQVQRILALAFDKAAKFCAEASSSGSDGNLAVVHRGEFGVISIAGQQERFRWSLTVGIMNKQSVGYNKVVSGHCQLTTLILPSDGS